MAGASLLFLYRIVELPSNAALNMAKLCILERKVGTKASVFRSEFTAASEMRLSRLTSTTQPVLAGMAGCMSLCKTRKE